MLDTVRVNSSTGHDRRDRHRVVYDIGQESQTREAAGMTGAVGLSCRVDQCATAKLMRLIGSPEERPTGLSLPLSFLSLYPFLSLSLLL